MAKKKIHSPIEVKRTKTGKISVRLSGLVVRILLRETNDALTITYRGNKSTQQISSRLTIETFQSVANRINWDTRVDNKFTLTDAQCCAFVLVLIAYTVNPYMNDFKAALLKEL